MAPQNVMTVSVFIVALLVLQPVNPLKNALQKKTLTWKISIKSCLIDLGVSVLRTMSPKAKRFNTQSQLEAAVAEIMSKQGV